ncbi:hypothetical protein ES708_25563 [subsurface metagenome]
MVTFRRNGGKFAPEQWKVSSGMVESLPRIMQKQVRKILSEYIDYYNHLRPHQGIGSIPEKNYLEEVGNIKKRQILGGLHHHYYRNSA